MAGAEAEGRPRQIPPGGCDPLEEAADLSHDRSLSKFPRYIALIVGSVLVPAALLVGVARPRRSGEAARAVTEGFARAQRLAPPATAGDDVVALVAMAVKALERPTSADIGRHLEGLHIATPLGGKHWAPSSVQNLLARGVEQ